MWARVKKRKKKRAHTHTHIHILSAGIGQVLTHCLSRLEKTKNKPKALIWMCACKVWCVCVHARAEMDPAEPQLY